ncbi:MAG: Cu(I)-responsive transcriptional regulator [Burkholderiales bacterium]|jgi:MerR family copper efflux transcriptional regulator|nr:Cu(I)-responsive transcriptional regulator [Burkholderiales bacterium]
MNIGEAARESGVSAKMIRHYEANGLIPKAARSLAGYRRYSESDVHTLRFIRRARDSGFDTAAIRQLLSLWHDRRRPAREVKRLALAHVDALGQRIAELQSMTTALAHLAATCHGSERPDCPILDAFAAGGEGSAAAKARPKGALRRGGGTRRAK